MLARLVSFDTTSRNSNLELISFVRSWLDAHKVPYRVSTEPDGSKANIHAIIGPHTPGGIALAGHVDTVPADGQAWTADPFTLRTRDGKLYGRGAADMKGFVAAILAAVPDLVARNLARPMHLMITYDEEVTFAGAHRIVADLRESALWPALCVVGEPSGMKPILAHKGKIDLQVSVRGLTGHSSEPHRGVNAVQAGAEAVAWVAREARRLAAEGPFEEGFDPPHTTMHVGEFRGGTILNVIPERAAFAMEWRTIPADDHNAMIARFEAHVRSAIEPAMHSVSRDTGFTINKPLWFPGMSLSAEHELATLVKHLTGTNSAGKVSYATEGGLYQESGIPTIVCGPGHIAQAHQPDEWVAQDQLDTCDSFIRRLAERLLV